MARTAEEFEPYTSWENVLSEARRDRYSLWYWGAMMRRPGRLLVVRVFRNGKVRVASGTMRFTLNSGHLTAGTLYRRT